MKGKNFLISLGATREYLDTFRFISNASSGKMGLAIANALYQRGGEVFLVCGDVKITIPTTFSFVRATTTKEMEEKMLVLSPKYDCVVMCAAVSDYQAEKTNLKKVKQESWKLSLQKTTDILAKLGEQKTKGKLLVGFAAESENLTQYAKEKLKTKNLDLIFANKIGSKDSGFESDNSEYQIISSKENTELKKGAKKKTALELVDWISELL